MTKCQTDYSVKVPLEAEYCGQRLALFFKWNKSGLLTNKVKLLRTAGSFGKLF